MFVVQEYTTKFYLFTDTNTNTIIILNINLFGWIVTTGSSGSGVTFVIEAHLGSAGICSPTDLTDIYLHILIYFFFMSKKKL